MAAPIHPMGVGMNPQMQQMQQPMGHPQHVGSTGHQQAVGPHPSQQPQQMQAQGPAHPQQNSQHSASETDPIGRFKNLLPRLKESLVNLFKVGGHLFYHNASQDEGGQYENVPNRFEKSLEEFYAYADQIEMSLRLAQEIIAQDKESNRNTPVTVVPYKVEGQQGEGQPYSQYLSTIQGQISCAKEIRDLLHDCLKNFPEHSSHP